MAQHMLLILVAAPLLVLGTPLSPFLLALPAPARTVLGRWWKRTSWARMAWHTLTQPVVVWALHTLALWLWHAPGPYQAALGNESLHALEHFSFLSTALLFWWAVARTPGRRTAGQGVSTLYLFTMALQSGLLGVLITFAPQPWYPAYAATTPAWNLTPLEDQQLAGVIMWIPAGVVYLIAALVGLGLWLRVMERADRAMIETAQLEITN
ncbi:MAG: cytochrome c oxidase assembly protein, partial [Anaerolineales bacterium]